MASAGHDPSRDESDRQQHSQQRQPRRGQPKLPRALPVVIEMAQDGVRRVEAWREAAERAEPPTHLLVGGEARPAHGTRPCVRQNRLRLGCVEPAERRGFELLRGRVDYLGTHRRRASNPDRRR